MASKEAVKRHISFAFTGWITGVVATLLLGLSWPIFFPAIVRPEHYYGPGPGLPIILAIAALVASPGALLGGFVGGRLSIEGGAGSQRLFAAIIGIILAMPCGCYSLWYFTGF